MSPIVNSNDLAPPAPVATSKRHKGSKLGFGLSILALLLAGMSSILVRAGDLSQATDKAQRAVEKGTLTVLGSLLSMPLIVGAIAIGGLAILLALVRLPKVTRGGLVLNLLALGVGGWAVWVAAANFSRLAN